MRKEKLKVTVDKMYGGIYMATIRIGMISNAIQVSHRYKKKAIAGAIAAALEMGYEMEGSHYVPGRAGYANAWTGVKR